MPGELIKGTQDCIEWHAKDYGEYIMYWCELLAEEPGSGDLPFDWAGIIKECYKDQEYGWAGKVDAIMIPCADYSEENAEPE